MNLSASIRRSRPRSVLVAALGFCMLGVLPAAAQQRPTLSGEDARQHARAIGLPIREETPERVMELQAFVNGVPWYYITDNLIAAQTISTDECWPGGSSGLGLTGAGVTLGVWDGGGVRTSHVEFGGWAVQIDSPSDLSSHSTHVAGTMIAAGINAAAHGMSPAALLNCWDWNDDATEMAAAAGSGLRVSNHSYSIATGWFRIGYDWYWNGDVTVSTTEDNRFGLYMAPSAELDQIACDHPQYLMCRSAGNDRDDAPPPGVDHHYWDPNSGQWVWSTATRDPDGPWDCIGPYGVAKNILTVGAVKDMALGYGGPASVEITVFSSWGPTDDGRIKPDICGNGLGLYSCDSTSDSAYTTYNGTSMSAPNVSGSLGLLIQHWRGTHPGEGDMRAATLKGLVLHTADEAGAADGPDYSYGWGLMNTHRAAHVISADVANPGVISERTLADGQVFELVVTTDGSASQLRASICWTDPPGTPPGNLLNPPNLMLVNDLDLRIEKQTPATTYYPWVLNPASPDSPATTGDNFRDNYEQVVVNAPGANSCVIRVTHKGTLTGGSQAYTLIVTGDTRPPTAVSADYDMFVNTTLPITLAATDDGLPVPPGALTYLVTALPAHGVLADAQAGVITTVPYTLVNGGHGVVYTPATGYTGSDVFHFQADDGGVSPDGGLSNVGVISLRMYDVDPPALQVTPQDGLAATGPVGGPFTPGSQVYTLTNLSSTWPMDYSVSKNRSWVSLSGAATGTLAAGASTTITVSINDAANAFASGVYSGTVSFVNTTNHDGDTTRGVMLLVGALNYRFPLDTDPGWTRTGQWAFGHPTGQGGSHGNPDPADGATGANVFGVNLNGDYSTSVGGPYYVTTGALNLTNRVNVTLKFMRWLNTDRATYVSAKVDVSNDGAVWTNVWANSTTAAITDSAWSQFTYDISSVADNQPTVYIRWSHQVVRSGAYAFSGWNIDDVEIWAVSTEPPPPGDLNGDGVVDIDDFVIFGGCMAGPDVPYAGGCNAADLEVDGDVDLGDFADLQKRVTGGG